MFLETSAKTAYNVVEAFNLSAQSILNNSGNMSNSSDVNKEQSKVILNNKTQTAPNVQKKGCC